MTRRWWLAGSAAAVVVCLVVVAFWLNTPGAESDGSRLGTATSSESPSSEDARELSSPDAAQLEAALGSGDPVVVGGVLAIGAGETPSAELMKALAGSNIDVEEASFESAGTGTGWVRATVTGKGQTETWRLLVQQREGSWVVAGSVPVA